MSDYAGSVAKNRPNLYASEDDLTSTFDARKLYEDVVGLLKRTNQLLETDTRLLKERLSRVSV